MMLVSLLLLFLQDVAGLNDRAQALAAQGKTEEAAELWRSAHRQAPQYFPAAFNLGFFHYSRKEYALAAPYLKTAARAQPTDFNARFLLGQVLSAMGQTDAALREWRAALTLQPKHAKLLGILTVEYGKAGYLLEAAAAAKRALALRAEDLTTHLLAVKACQEAQDPEGPALAARGVEKFPQSAKALFEHAWYLQRAGRAAESVEFLKRAIALDATDEEPYYFYGGILLDEGKLPEAVEMLQKAVQLRPDYTAAAVALGRALMEGERWGEAVQVLEEAARLSPKHPQPPLMLSRLYYRAGEEEKARQAKELSLRLRRENATMMESRQGRTFRP